MQMFSKPDLFVKLSAGDSYAQTETIKDKRNPVWDESFIMWPEQYGEDDLMGDVAEGPPVLKVTVFDEDWGFGKTVDDRLGNAEIQLPDDWETLDNVDYTVRRLMMGDHTVQWSEGMGKAGPFFGRSRFGFRVPSWVANTTARDHLSWNRRRSWELRTVV